MIDKPAVGERISAMRRETGCSQAALAEYLNVSTQAVSKWETGNALPELEALLNLSWMFKQSINAILEGEARQTSVIPGMDRGLSSIAEHLICPKCAGKLEPGGDEVKPLLACAQGHTYPVEDGVPFFGTREIQGELWSLLFRNYEQYLSEQRHPGSSEYYRGLDRAEVVWKEFERIRPRVILEIACGTSSMLKHIMKRIRWPATIIQADLSHRILKYNRQFFSTEWTNPYVDMVYLACDCANLPLADGCADVVFSNGGFESMQHKLLDGFQEGYRALKPGGEAVYLYSIAKDFESENTKKWMELMGRLPDSHHADFERIYDLRRWLVVCEQTGYRDHRTVEIYGELPAPEVDAFPYENQIMRWMCEFMITGKKE